ncbi:MAG TPA: hypothetical protein PK122_06280, partial [Candidatus Paceibacterota bacterium]|nr:hypothetical protein [Candidatus Paceibacterota bacterium]
MIVKENIEFQRGNDPQKAMGIGLESQMEEKYGKKWKIFKRCNDLAHISENFQWVSEIQFNEKDPYFNIESYFYYTDEENAKYNLQYVVILYPEEIYAKEIVNKDDTSITSVNDFVEFTEAFEPDDRGWQGLFESLDFERGQDPKEAIGIGWKSPKHFSSIKDAMKYVADHLPLILGKEEIPANIIKSKNFINSRYEDDISEYIDEYITWDDDPKMEPWSTELFWILQDRGFLFEAMDFERGKDPKEVLDIGAKIVIISKIQDLLNDDWGIEGRSLILDIEFVYEGDGILFSADDYDPEVDIPYIKDLIKKHGLDTYIDIVSPETLQQGLGTVTYFFWLTGAGEKANIKNQRFWIDGNDSSFQTEKTDGVLFHDKPIRESIDFKRGQDPHRALGIGEEGLRNKWGSLKKGDKLKVKKFFATDNRNHIIVDMSDARRKNRYYNEGESLVVENPAQIYDDGNVGFTNRHVHSDYTAHDDYFIWGSPVDIEEVLMKVNSFNESASFERGKD